MTAETRLFRWLDRAFWALWLAFPVYVWRVVVSITGQREAIAELGPDGAACVDVLPDPMAFSAAGQGLFWGVFAVNIAFFAALMALGHAIIRDCARGRVLIAPLIGRLKLIGIVIAAYPVADVILANGLMAALAATGDLEVWHPEGALDVTVMGVGLLLVAMSVAMAEAVRLREDADLTI